MFMLMGILLATILAENAVAEEEHKFGSSAVDVLEVLLASYDKQARPFDGGPPVNINVSIYINRITSVSETKMEFTVDAYFRQYWQDPRLEILGRSQQNFEVRLIGGMATKVWIPDIFIENEISSYVHASPVFNDYFRLSPGGNLFRSTRFTFTLACPMNLQYFPMDIQTCAINLQSYSYPSSEMRLKWVDQKKIIAQEQTLLPNFEVKGCELKSSTKELAESVFSMLQLHISLSRAVGFYIIQIYLPAALLVVISWFSLWMNRFIAERIALGLTTVLTITTLLSSLNATAPKIPYIKAIDVYMGICFTFVFMALLQSVAVAHRSRVRGNAGIKKETKGSQNPCKHHGDRPMLFFPQVQLPHDFRYDASIWPMYMDQVARIVFPVAFLAVNGIYWGYFLYTSSVQQSMKK